MRRPRIASKQGESRFERLMASPAVRYGLAVAAGGLLCAAEWVFGARIDADAFLLVGFAAILGCSVLGGAGPGLLATALVAAVAWGGPRVFSQRELGRLVVEGVMISFVGGTLRSTRMRAAEHFAETLRLERQILEINDDDRRRIGHDLHDGLGQHLTGISLLSETIAQQIAAGNQPDPDNVERITALVNEAISITRNLAKSVSPVTLESEGFVAAVEELADATSELFGIRCTWDSDEAQLTLDRTRSMHLYRIVQEAVNNSIRHGKAKNINITLRRAGEGHVTLTVVDDGIGLSERTATNPGLGLRIMQYRARMLGAPLIIERRSPESGTSVVCHCPAGS